MTKDMYSYNFNRIRRLHFMREIDKKLEDLRRYIASFDGIAVAFSGGVDSTFLLKVCHDVLGDRCIAITAQSESFPAREMEEAIAFCE
jgi:uncharacterized protein